MVNVYLSGQDARNAAADLWQSDQIKRLNDQYAPPPTPPAAPALDLTQLPTPQAAPAAAAVGDQNGGPKPAAVGPSPAQPAPPIAAPAPAPQPSEQATRETLADQWTRNAVADAWQQNAMADVMKGVSQAGQGVQQALSSVPQQAQGLVSNLTALPGATPSQPAPVPPGALSGTPAPPGTGADVGAGVAGQPTPAGDLQTYARRAAQRAGIDPDIFQRQIQQESGFNPSAQSPAGAQGVAQFMPATARGLGVDPTDPYQSLDGAARLMRQNLDRYGGDYSKALAAYNAGPGAVDAAGGVPNIPETRRYVSNILGGGGQQAASVNTQPVVRPAENWLAIAKEQLGKPYIWGSAGGRSTFDPNAPGFDCSGFVSYVMKTAFGVDLPAFTGDAYSATRPLQQGETPGAAGQVAFYNMGQSDPHLQHIALSIGNGQVIQAGGRRNDVNTDRADDIGTPEWRVPVGLSDQLGQAAQQVVGAGVAAAQQAGQNPQQAVQQTAQGLINTVRNLGQGLGSAWQQAQAANAADPRIQQMIASSGPSTINPYRNIVQEGIPSIVQGVQQGDVGKVLGGAWQTVSGAASVIPGTGGPGGIAGDIASTALGAADVLRPPSIARAATFEQPLTGQGILQSAMSELGKYPEQATQAIRAQAEQMQASGTPASTIGAQVQRWMGQNPLENFGQAPTLGREVTSTLPAGTGPLAAPAPPQQADTALQGLINMAKQRGYDTTDLEAQIRQPSGAAPEPPEIQAVRAAQNPPPQVNPADNGIPPPPGEPPAPPTSTNPEDFDRQVQGALEQQTRQPGSFWQVLNAFHSGNVVLGPATAAKVAVNTAFTPMWNLGTQTARDLLSLNLDRVGGRGVGVGQALWNVGNDFMDGFRSAMAGGVTSSNPLVNQFLQAQRAVGGALHAGMQNVAAEAVRRMELGAAAGEFVAAQRRAGVEGLGSIADLIRDPSSLPADAIARADDLAARAGLRAPAGATQQVVQNMLNQAANTPVGAVTNFLLPVFRIGAQAAARGIEASPIGLAGTAFDVARAGLGKGPYAAGFSQYGGAVTPLADRLTNNLAGTAVTAWLASKALDGTITGAGPDDPRMRANLEAQGWRPQSVLVPGVGYVSYNRLPEQLRVPLELAGSFGEASTAHKGDPMGTAAALFQGVGQMLARGLPGLQTLGDVGGILKGDPYAVGYLVGGGLAGYIPGSGALSNVASAMDPYARQIPTREGFGPAIAGTIQQGLPGLREQLQPRANVLGQSVPNPAAGLAQFLPVRTPGEVAPGTPGLAALSFLNQSGMTLPAAPSHVTYQGRQLALSPDEQQLRQQAVGQRLDQTLKGYMNSTQFQQLPPDQQKRALEPIVRAAEQYADQRVIAAMDPDDRKARLAMAPRTGAPAPVYSTGGGLAGLAARQSAAEADAAHQRLLASYSARSNPAALAQYAGQANPALAGPAVGGTGR